MIGIVIVAHLGLAEQLRNAAEIITRSTLENITAVSIMPDDNPDQAREKVLTAVKGVDKGRGVVILVDMFGGTPSNLSLSLLTKGKIEIITGVNLPMVVDAATTHQQASLSELVATLLVNGQRGIRSASEILTKKVPGKEES